MGEIKQHGLNLAQNPLVLQHGPVKIENIETVKIADMADSQALNGLVAKYVKGAASLVIWTFGKITWGRWDGSQIVLPEGQALPADIVEARIFNDIEELHLIREDGAIAGRYVNDAEGDDCYYVDSFARLWGGRDSQADIPEGYVRLVDGERKLKLDVPLDGESTGIKYFGLETRNYVASDERTGLSGYTDYRFVAIKPAWEVE